MINYFYERCLFYQKIMYSSQLDQLNKKYWVVMYTKMIDINKKNRQNRVRFTVKN
jgi:hypothetical protein